MDEIQPPLGYADAKDSFLDLLVTMAENAKLLVIGSMLAGLCALGASFLIPHTYQSAAVLQAEQSTASLMQTAAVLDPVIASLGLAKDTTVDEARDKLRGQIKTVVGRADKLLTLTVSDRSAPRAQAIAVAVLQRTFQESRLKGTVRTRLETQLTEARARLKSAQGIGESLRQRLELPSAPGNANTIANSEMARGYAELLGATGAAQSQIIALESQLEGLSDAQVVQYPTLPEDPSQPKKALIAIGATLAAGLSLLLFVFIRQAFRNSAANGANAAKLLRIRKSLGLGQG